MAQISYAVLEAIEIVRPGEMTVGHRVVEYEAGAAHEMASMGVVNGAIVFEKMEEAATRIDRSRMIESHGALNVIDQERPAAEIWRHAIARRCHRPAASISVRTRLTKANVGGVAPACRHAAAPVATEKRRCAVQSAAGSAIKLYSKPPMLASPAPTVSTTLIGGGRCTNTVPGRCSSAPSLPRVNRIGAVGLSMRRRAKPSAGRSVRNSPMRSSSE